MHTAPLARHYPARDRPLSVQQQIQRGVICCPASREPLTPQDKLLKTASGIVYPMQAGVPILLADREQAQAYVGQSEQMVSQYDEYGRDSLAVTLKKTIFSFIEYPWQSRASIAAHRRTYVDKDGLCLAIGGGPSRSHPRAVNVNISNFVNVDVVADAHHLPYVDNSVDSIICEDVLEHIQDPSRAVAEMFRVLKPGGMLYSSTPFLIPYHGYPCHFQNFTMQGHATIYETSGFKVVDKGPCLGPFTTILSYIGFLFSIYLPKTLGLRKIICRSWTLLSSLVKPLDRLFLAHPQAWQVSLSTFVLARKPHADTN